jgi:hypothetical protein
MQLLRRQIDDPVKQKRATTLHVGGALNGLCFLRDRYSLPPAGHRRSYVGATARRDSTLEASPVSTIVTPTEQAASRPI